MENREMPINFEDSKSTLRNHASNLLAGAESYISMCISGEKAYDSRHLITTVYKHIDAMQGILDKFGERKISNREIL